MTHSNKAVIASRIGHMLGLSAMLTLTCAFIFTVL